MRLTYFVGPYDLLDEKTGTSHQMTVEGKKQCDPIIKRNT